MIISASRRSDLPAYQLPAFLRALEAGFIEVANPFNAAQRRRVSLAPEDVDCLVFWTRDPRPLLSRLDELGPCRDRCFVHVTLTAYPPALEPRVPPAAAVIEAIGSLAAAMGPGRLAWRYDPLILAGELELGWHEDNFRRLAAALGGRVSRVVFSLLDEYRATRSRLARAGYPGALFGSPQTVTVTGGAKEPETGVTVPHNPRPAPQHEARVTVPHSSQPELPGLASEAPPPRLPPEPWPSLLRSLAAIAAEKGLPAQACAEPFDLETLGIARRACIDGPELGELFGFPASTGRDKGQRGACSCSPSVDVGSYGDCPSGCVYCYARR